VISKYFDIKTPFPKQNKYLCFGNGVQAYPSGVMYKVLRLLQPSAFTSGTEVPEILMY